MPTRKTTAYVSPRVKAARQQEVMSAGVVVDAEVAKGKAPVGVTEPADPDVSAGCLGELHWYWPEDRRYIGDDGVARLRKLSVADFEAMDDEYRTECVAVCERYLVSFRDTVPASAKLAKVKAKRFEGEGVYVKDLKTVTDHIIDTHQPA